jgi:hypothetical protein
MRYLGSVAAVVWIGASMGAVAPATQPSNPFRESVRVEVTDTALVVRSNGIPDHITGEYPNAKNPNSIKEQDYTFRIPTKAVFSTQVTPLPMGPIGIAINGVPFYNPFNRQGKDATKFEIVDDCCGHPDALGRYHYHIYPKCIKTSFADPKGVHSPLIGYAFDGFAIYGINGDGGKAPTDLDECNGHTDSVRGYHYHVTRNFPYIIGGYHGVPDRSNFDHAGGPPRGQR